MSESAMTSDELRQRHCLPCEGGVPAYTAEQARQQLGQLTGWTLTDDSQRIRKQWNARSFVAAIEFFKRVAELAESEQHHPDLHLTSYRQVAIEIWTHAIDGLSENDFILAAKIDKLPIDLKSSK